MEKLLVVPFFLFCFSVSANDFYNCQYAKANTPDRAVAPLSMPMPSKVEVSAKSIKLYRPDGSYVSSPRLSESKNNLLMADDGSKVYAAAKDRTNFAVSDRIAKTTEQWDKCSLSIDEERLAKIKTEMEYVETMNSAQAKKYFLREKHAFATNCLAWDDVTMITGPNPAMLIAGSVNMGKKPNWDGKEYSFIFNGGSMIARFTPSKGRHKLLIQAGSNFYGCGPSEIDHDYD